jgi:hypothetical protein
MAAPSVSLDIERTASGRLETGEVTTWTATLVVNEELNPDHVVLRGTQHWDVNGITGPGEVEGEHYTTENQATCTYTIADTGVTGTAVSNIVSFETWEMIWQQSGIPLLDWTRNAQDHIMLPYDGRVETYIYELELVKK